LEEKLIIWIAIQTGWKMKILSVKLEIDDHLKKSEFNEMLMGIVDEENSSPAWTCVLVFCSPRNVLRE
jgi:hypothetical protein